MPITSLLSRNVQNKDFNIPVSRGTSYQLINGRLVSYTDNPVTYLQKGYDINDIVYSIVNLIMDKCRVAPWGIYEIKDESAYKQFRGMMTKGITTGRDYQAAVKWGELIKNPNERQSWNDLIAYGVGYDCLMGNNYTWGKPLTAGANAGTPNELWLMPSQHVDIHATDTFPARVTKYTVRLWPSVVYEPKEVMHEAEWNPNWEVNGSQLYGIPPLRAALGLLNRNNSSMEASAAAFQNEGIKGVLHMKATPGQIDGEQLITEVGNLKDTMLSEWTGEQNRGRIGLSGYDMGWLPIGLSSDEMQLIESEKWDLRRLCNVFRVSSRMLNDPDNTAEANVEEAEKALTTRAALPRLIKKREAFNRKAVRDWGLDKKYTIDFEMSAYSELSDDMGEVIDAHNKLIIAIPNEQREAGGLAAVDDPTANDPWVKSGNVWMPLADAQANAVDAALNEEDDTEEDIPGTP
jgi:phage portal protein BeeE